MSYTVSKTKTKVNFKVLIHCEPWQICSNTLRQHT